LASSPLRTQAKWRREKGIAAAEAKVKEGIKDGIAAVQKHVIALLVVACTLFMLGV
jgi:hypothetical protein